MKSDKEKVKWCLKQKKGIRIDEPNPTLSMEYLKKARSSLNMLGAAIEKEEEEWAATIAYYARYYAVYALFEKCGIISEIHDCTIAAFSYLFADEGIVPSSLHDELIGSKESRIDAQYYVKDELDKTRLCKDAEKARAFVLAIEEVLDRINEDTIEKIRSRLKRS